MKKIKILAGIALVGVLAVACTELQQVAGEVLTTPTTGEKPLTNEEVISGLKEALTVGAKNSVSLTSAVDGFNGNSLIRIPFPPEAEKVRTKALELGLDEQVEKFELTLNRAAEAASKEAVPIFVDAIKGMSIGDGFAILRGEDNAATNYLREKTSAQLMEKFRPVVNNATQQVELTKYWNPIITTYNKIPFVEKQNPDLDAYVTERAMAGLFTMVEKEEKKIRDNPAARVSDILKKVFGSLDK